MKPILLILLAYVLSSCSKEKSTDYYAYLKNTTGHQISIQPYFAGHVIQANIIMLSP